MVDFIHLHCFATLPRYEHKGKSNGCYYDNPKPLAYFTFIGKDGAELEVTDYVTHFYIEGSLRKWYLGKFSHQDLTFKQFIKAIKKLASELGVDIYDILAAKIIKIEFGRTFALKGTLISNVISKIDTYSTFNDPVKYRSTSVTFKGQDYHLIFYDKGEEIRSSAPKLIKDDLQLGQLLRIEFRYKDRKGIDSKFLGIKDCVDLLVNYRKCVVLFLKEIKKVRFKTEDTSFHAVSFTGKTIKDVKKYLIYRGILEVGTPETLKFVRQLQIAKQGRYKYEGEFKDILTEFELTDKYSRKQLLREIKVELARVISDPVACDLLLQE